MDYGRGVLLTSSLKVAVARCVGPVVPKINQIFQQWRKFQKSRLRIRISHLKINTSERGNFSELRRKSTLVYRKYCLRRDVMLRLNPVIGNREIEAQENVLPHIWQKNSPKY